MQGSNNFRGKLTAHLGLAMALLGIILAPAAHAASDTAAARLHRTQQPAGSIASKSSKSKTPARAGHRSSHSVAQSTTAPRSHRHTPQPEFVPPVMSRVHSTPRSRARELRERAAAHPLTESFSVRATARCKTHRAPGADFCPAGTDFCANRPMTAAKTLTTEDFVRAAGAASAPEATIAPATPSYTPAPLPPSPRPEGFGAEGAILSASRRTPSPARTPAPPSEPSVLVLDALLHPSHEDCCQQNSAAAHSQSFIRAMAA